MDRGFHSFFHDFQLADGGIDLSRGDGIELSVFTASDRLFFLSQPIDQSAYLVAADVECPLNIGAFSSVLAAGAIILEILQQKFLVHVAPFQIRFSENGHKKEGPSSLSENGPYYSKFQFIVMLILPPCSMDCMGCPSLRCTKP